MKVAGYSFSLEPGLSVCIKPKREPTVINMDRADPVPHYDAWVPVSKEFFVGREFYGQAYMPYFGDDERNREAAFDLYEKMSKKESGGSSQEGSADASDSDGVSDGDLDATGNFREPASEAEWMKYDSLSMQRLRASRKEALRAVVHQYGRSTEVLKYASFGLGMPSAKHAARVLDIDERKRSREAQRNCDTRRLRHKRDLVADAMVSSTPESRSKESKKSRDGALHALRYFCFSCHLFNCARHVGENVEPVVPIVDNYVEQRCLALQRSRKLSVSSDYSSPNSIVHPCGADCHLLSQWNAAVSQMHERTWSAEEQHLLIEALSIFKEDPCSIAAVLGGSKSCAEVAQHLERPNVQTKIASIVRGLSNIRWPKPRNRGRLSAGGQRRRKRLKTSSGDGTPEESPEMPADAGTGSDSDSDSDGNDSSGEGSRNVKDFKPCAHRGPCTTSSGCSCVKFGYECEATCGCNAGRWTMNGLELGRMKSTASEGGLKCQRRHWGCDCSSDSLCNTARCKCWQLQRACDPDFCRSCRTCVLPFRDEDASTRKGCRNSGVPTGRHKRTLVGKSAIHGFGLYAGETFYEGDLIGVYGAQVLHTDNIEMLDHLYNAKDHTFFFDVTETLVVDGGMVGMKSKFINHVAGGSQEENCISRCVRVRGTPHIALFATRVVQPGEEFRFDYKFQQAVPDWAKS